MIPRLDAQKIRARDADTLAAIKEAATGVGFMTVHNTALTPARVKLVIAAYRAFFDLPAGKKVKVDMSKTGSNRGWGAPGSEQVNPDAAPDYKQVFDSGYAKPGSDLSCYAPNLWPETPEGFEQIIEAYYRDARDVAMAVLSGIAEAIGEERDYFEDKFAHPMALLRGNFYPKRPKDAGADEFGIATHTDYGCLTLLASDGVPGLEVRLRGGGWLPVSAEPGEFIINFGEMLEFWTEGRVKATPHRVVGTTEERISIPLFFNPNYETNIAPAGSQSDMTAGEHLSKRYQETYVHLQKA